MQKIMAKMACRDYGFGCSYETNEDIAEKIIEEFRTHILQKHHIDYSEGVLMKFVLRKKHKKILLN